MILEGKTVVISGVGPGLGREIAVAAVREGANAVIGARTESNLVKVSEELDPSGDRVAWAVTDVTDPVQCQRLADVAVERFGRIDALVNNAALDAIFGGIEDADFSAWRKAFDINLYGSMQMCQSVLPALKERGGSIVFIGSQAMWWSQVPQAAYGASKAALIGAITHLVRELGPHKIRVNTVAPSWMWGPPVEAYVNWTAKSNDVPAEQVLDGLTSKMPLGEMPTDGDVAEAVIFFASDRARMITGQMLLINAGEYIR
jgi:NAD(P)-dependent dehydrogenase (short-subunit alcohol dehydrogenase family)